MVFKKDDFQKAARYFKSYGLKAFVIKALARFKLIRPYVLWIKKFEPNDETVKSQPKLSTWATKIEPPFGNKTQHACQFLLFC
jgi:hypothetical protein